MNQKQFNRRTFLKVTATASGGFLLAFAVPTHFDSAVSDQSTYTLNPFLRIGADNQIHVILSKVEMGQGIWTTLPMLLAEELDCDWQSIQVEHRAPGTKADFLETPEPVLQSTGGSESTKNEFDKYRIAGATARIMLVQAAAKRLGVPIEACKTTNGYVIVGKKRRSYGELAKEAAQVLVPKMVPLRDSKDWKRIGKSQKRLDAPAKVNGSVQYGIDTYVEGMLTAVVAHAPTFGGKVKSLDDTRAKAIKGVQQIVQIPSGVAVLADNFWAAKTGRDALVIEWEQGSGSLTDSQTQLKEYDAISRKQGQVFHRNGDVIKALKESPSRINAEFWFPYLAHAPMEPLNCTVRISENRCEVWVGTQSPLLHQAEIAAFLGLPPEQVLLHTPHLGGSFGRRGSFSMDWVMEAVQIAKISGKLIKLVWTREDDIRGGYYRPTYLHQVAVGIGPDGLPKAWKHTIVGQSLFKNTPLEKYIVSNGIDYSLITTGKPYTESLPDQSFELIITANEVPVLPWRSVGNTHTAFVVETLIDELACLAKTDPVVYRQKLLPKDSRYLTTLNEVAEKAEWTKPLPKGRFRGIAVHEAMGSCVAQVVEISVVDNAIHVHRVVCVIDCGLAVNPDGIKAQMEGGIIFALSAALYGEITLENGQVQQSNFHDYPLLRLHETPHIEVHILASSDKIGGAGEPGVPPVAPALANALFAVTGKRLRSLPLRLER